MFNEWRIKLKNGAKNGAYFYGAQTINMAQKMAQNQKS